MRGGSPTVRGGVSDSSRLLDVLVSDSSERVNHFGNSDSNQTLAQKSHTQCNRMDIQHLRRKDGLGGFLHIGFVLWSNSLFSLLRALRHSLPSRVEDLRIVLIDESIEAFRELQPSAS